MTHDELLAKINEHMKSYGECNPYPCDDPDNPFFCAWKSLRAVVELHKPTEPLKWRGYRKVGDEWIVGCSCGSDRIKGGTEHPYPCPTIQAIEKELG